jgi:hypothetical protein
MAITSIVRDLLSNYIVRVTTSDNLATVAGAGYVTAQTPNITALNHGVWDWQVGDMVLVAASDGDQFFEFSGSDFSTLIQLPGGNGAVTLPVVANDFVVFNGTLGALKDLGFSASNPAKTKVVMANGASIVNHIATYTDTAGTIGEDAATAINGGNIQAGLSGTAGSVISYPAAASNGHMIMAAVGNAGNFNATISSISTLGQSTVYTVPDPGAATANFLLDAGTNASGTFTVANIVNLKYGATPVAQVDPASCTIVAAAGASNVANVTIQLKDGSGTNMARSIAFKVYASSAADGLTLASAASTGFAVASGGLSLANGSAVTTQISAMSSATGGCVLSLTDTAKQTSYLVLVLPNGNKISAQLSSGSYGA